MRIHPSALIVEEWSLNEPLEVVPLGFGCFASVSVFSPHSLLVLLHVLAMNQTKKISVALDLQLSWSNQ